MLNVSTYTFVEALALTKIDTDKNERFVLDGLQLLNALSDLKKCEEKILELVNNLKVNRFRDNNDIFREFDNANYQKIKINDIVSTIILHSSKIVTSEEFLDKFTTTTQKNVAISDITISKNIIVSDTIPDFKFKITNLGLYGIKKTDIAKVTIYNDSLIEKTEKEYILNSEILNIGDSSYIDILNMPCPQRQYEYNLKIQIISENRIIYEKIKQGINIVDARNYSLMEEFDVI